MTARADRRPRRTQQTLAAATPTGPCARDLRDRLMRRYQAGGSRWSSLDCFAADHRLDAGEVYRLVCQTECSMRLRDSILAMDRQS